jgi:hypothetical protein
LLRRADDDGRKQIEAVVFHLREQPLSKIKFDPKSSTTNSWYSDQLSRYGIKEKSGSTGCATRPAKRHESFGFVR